MKIWVLALGISLLSIGYAKQTCTYYVVKEGDTLEKIAKNQGVSIKDVMKANKGINPARLKPGTKICIPSSEAHKKTKLKKEGKKEEERYAIYVVRKGDTIESIAESFGVSPKELIRVNKLKSRKLVVGQQIKIPPRTVKESSKKESSAEVTETKEKYTYYIVKKGARLEHVAKATGVPLETLEKLNPELKGKWLKKGQKVKIPVTHANVESEEKIKYKVHRVRRGETLQSIARKYGVSAEELAKLNGLRKHTRLHAGQKIKVPIKVTTEPEKPKVQPEKLPAPPVVKEAPAEKPVSSSTIGSLPMPVSGKIQKVANGVDIQAECGKPVKAVADGKVIYSGNDLQAYGNMIIIQHDNFISVYAYNQENLVKRGDSVEKGQVIAKVGKKNGSDECLLHFELRNKDGAPVDPTEHLKP
ncbi:LysM peptidoglycan-binding domain-containing protein [Thermocrinis minervae]|uniref:Murein DD-endopeptidase MepM and murein hydrolase activator NlpD, contain LysM domain n=1 Tax=Thermocrinis minervae TaxID=381751 RepID=A0A1M6QIW6_9AQUI|nr:LysM peptidoglycan-binding domain-containing protein [Thermocrinis minervae]SHK20003.1 Murein DD-endopeptidase MepM and murein hydrolase activator NlpD, contain LysM domain [Thermocrinis minervae]